jgi:hypothetical protein
MMLIIAAAELLLINLEKGEEEEKLNDKPVFASFTNNQTFDEPSEKSGKRDGKQQY